MRNNNIDNRDAFDRKMARLADGEQMAVPETLNARIDEILGKLDADSATPESDGHGDDIPDDTHRIKNRATSERSSITGHHYSFRRAVILAAACLVLASATAVASGLYQARMESMNREKLEEYFTQLQETNVAADTYSRPLTGSEQTRLAQLQQAYREEGYFPKKELKLIDSPDKYHKGVAFYAERSLFFLPEGEMSDEELLELIDFREKRDYSLARISEEIAAGTYEYTKPENSTTNPSGYAVAAGQTGAQHQEQEKATIALDANTATQEWNIAYTGDLSIRCGAATENGLYVGGYTMEGQVRVEFVPYGSGTPETFYEDFTGDGEIYSLCAAPDGSVYAAWRGLAAPGAEHGWLPEIYHINSDGSLQNSFTVGEREWNIVDSMALDAQGRLYTLMRMQENGSYVRIYAADGEFIGAVADDDGYRAAGTGALGQGRDGRVYAAVEAKNGGTSENTAITLAVVDPEKLQFTDASPASAETTPTDATSDTTFRWRLVAAAVDNDDADFILWGYSGVDAWNRNDAKPTRIQESWEMPCGTEGTCAVLVPDGRILYIGASGGVQGTTADGIEISGKDPKQTVFYYVPLAK